MENIHETTYPEIDTLQDIPHPAFTSNIIGHEPIIETLSALYQENKLAHAYLFTGIRGIGKASTAFNLTRKILTDDKNHIQTVKLIEARAHPDFVYINRPFDTKSKKFRQSILIDDIRAIDRLFHSKPTGTGFRVCIIDAADDMNRNAANALLKILEEPPEKSVFFLISHQPAKLLATIRSRCRMIKFSPLTSDEIIAVAQHILSGISHHESIDSLKLAEGSVRKFFEYNTEEIQSLYKELQLIFSQMPKIDNRQLNQLADNISTTQAENLWHFTLDQIGNHVRYKMHEEITRNSAASQLTPWQTLWNDCENARKDLEIYNLDKKALFFELVDKLASIHKK